MARGANLTGVHVWAQEFVDKRFRSDRFDLATLLAALTRKGTSVGALGRPGTAAIITGAASISKSQLMSTTGSTQKQLIFNTGSVGGGKYLGSDDTTASTGASRQNTQWQSAFISWCLYEQPITLQNSVLRKAKDKYAYGNVLETNTHLAMSEAMDRIADDLYTGNPASQTAEDWSEPLGLQQWIQDANTVGGVDRAVVNGFDGVRITSAQTASLGLMDDAMIDYDGAGNGLIDKGGSADLWFTSNALYRILKREALAAGAQLVTNSIPTGHELGVLKEYVNYNGHMIVLDPFCPASHLFGLTSNTWVFEVMGDENWRTKKFVDLGEDGPQGSPDVTQSAIRIGYRFYTDRPARNIQYTSVS